MIKFVAESTEVEWGTFEPGDIVKCTENNGVRTPGRDNVGDILLVTNDDEHPLVRIGGDYLGGYMFTKLGRLDVNED